mmetsp:Transcript_33473/g.81622  ORF Transcript_33473/g.81622 Transcript_33473/m.81622 type:complete len:226 (+) Transcript_33473:265-942(+)
MVEPKPITPLPKRQGWNHPTQVFKTSESAPRCSVSQPQPMLGVPDHPSGSRFCRKCASFLPISEFHGGAIRRFECKRHALERARKYRSNARPDPIKKSTERVWHAVWADSKAVFGRRKAGLTKAEVLRLFADKGMHPDTTFRIVPRDPGHEWGFNNARPAVVCPIKTRESVRGCPKSSRPVSATLTLFKHAPSCPSGPVFAPMLCLTRSPPRSSANTAQVPSELP